MGIQDLSHQVFGQYELRELLGAGGMGAVYRAYQMTLKREVAIKVMPPALASEPDYMERFTREAETAASLEHPHIIPVYDYGVERGTSYIVMRMLSGGTLADRMAQIKGATPRMPSLGEIAVLLRQIAGAFDYAHNQGVIHRDVKPSNIMFDNHGNAFLVDFGIAKLLANTSALTATGAVLGTPLYMAPEQWRAEQPTAATDQYALGVTIYQVLTGSVPFEAPTPFGLMHKHLNERPPSPHVLRPDIPEAVSIVLERAMAKEPQQRFQSITALAQSFESAIAGQRGEATQFFTAPIDITPLAKATKRAAQPAAATPVSASNQATPPRQAAYLSGEFATPAAAAAQTAAQTSVPFYRRPTVLGGVVVTVAILAVLGVILALGGSDDQSGGDNNSTPTGLAAAVNSATPDASAPTASSGGILIVGTVTPTDETLATPETLEPVFTTSAPALTGTAIAALPQVTDTAQPSATPTKPPTVAPTDTPTTTSTETPTASATPTELPSATPTATATATSTSTATSTDTATPSATATLTPTVTFTPTFTPTSTPTSTATVTPSFTPSSVPTMTPQGGGAGQIAFVSERDGNREIYVMNADGSNPIRLTHNTGDDWDPAWSSDGTQIVFYSTRDGHGEVYIMNADGSNERNLSNNFANDYHPAWSPDGSRIMFYSDRGGNGDIYLVNPDGTNLVNITNNPADDGGADWAPDGSQIVFNSKRDGNSEIYVMYADGSYPTRLTNNSGDDSAPTWSPDGTRIAYMSYLNGNWEIVVMDANGANPRNLTNATSNEWWPEWSEDGTYLAFNSDRQGVGSIYLMRADGSSSPIALTGANTWDDSPAWRPAPNGTPAVITAVPTIFAATLPPTTQSTCQLTFTATVNVRSGPDTAYHIIGAASTSDVLTVIGRIDGPWWQVQFGQTTGWVLVQLASVYNQGDCNAVPIVTP